LPGEELNWMAEVLTTMADWACAGVRAQRDRAARMSGVVRNEFISSPGFVHQEKSMWVAV
jgi:hypothetical protein